MKWIGAYAWKIASLVVAFLVAALWIKTTGNSLRRSPDEIAASLRNSTPIGTGFEEVESRLRSKGLTPEISPNVGFLRQGRGASEVVGAKSIRASLGEYRTSFCATTSVTAFWGFDQRGALFEIWVWKTVDSL